MRCDFSPHSSTTYSHPLQNVIHNFIHMLVGCFYKEFFTYSQSFPLPTYDYFYINIFIFLRKKRKETLTNLPLVIQQIYLLFFCDSKDKKSFVFKRLCIFFNVKIALFFKGRRENCGKKAHQSTG